jgi:hypothetical protein
LEKKHRVCDTCVDGKRQKCVETYLMPGGVLEVDGIPSSLRTMEGEGAAGNISTFLLFELTQMKVVLDVVNREHRMKSREASSGGD